jgi:hypothetical protein
MNIHSYPSPRSCRRFPTRLRVMSAPDNGDKDNSGDLLSFETWRRKAMSITGLGLSPEEARKRRKMRELEVEAADLKKCEKWKTELWHNSAFPEQFFMPTRSLIRRS